jgi:hypothetical protein
LLRAACVELRADAAAGSPASVIVESTRPLGEAATGLVSESLGLTPAQITWRVVPALVAGVRLLTPGGAVDASAAGVAAQVERVLAARMRGEEPADG